mgnify:CR=1 FL=1
MSFIGPDENGGNSVWAFASDVKMSDGSTAADLTEQELKAAGLTYDSQDTSGASFYLASITCNGKTYGWDQSTGRYWQLYVNGEYSQKMAGQITLKPGDKVQWVYAADNEKPLEGLIVNPFASRPDWTASWNGFGNAGGTTLVNTPTPPSLPRSCGRSIWPRLPISGFRWATPSLRAATFSLPRTPSSSRSTTRARLLRAFPRAGPLTISRVLCTRMV